MLANVDVSEAKPPVDTDSPLSYTMEGSRQLPPSSAIPFFWSPGWNSVQSVNKYQEEVGASLRGGDPGLRLFEPVKSQAPKYFMGVPEPFKPLEDHLWVVALHHIFGSDELSAQAKAISQRVPKPYVMINTQDAVQLNMQEGSMLKFEIEKHDYVLPVKICSEMPVGLAGIPYGLTSYSELPAWGILKKV